MNLERNLERLLQSMERAFKEELKVGVVLTGKTNSEEPEAVSAWMTPTVSIQEREKIQDLVGKQMTEPDLREVFGLNYEAVCKFFERARRESCIMVCVSREAADRHQNDGKLLFFKITNLDESPAAVTFYGLGRPPYQPPIECGFAAETYGYKFLALGRKSGQRRGDGTNVEG